MKIIFEGLDIFLRGLAVVLSLIAGAVILVIASILGKLQSPKNLTPSMEEYDKAVLICHPQFTRFR